MKKIGLLFLIIIALDRLSKIFALHFLADVQEHVCYGFNLLITWNRGVSWSMLSPDSTTGFWLLFSLIALIIVFFARYTYTRLHNNAPVGFEMLVLAGACSNMIDRLIYGAVLDFIQVYAGSYYFPVFNVADMSICVGVFGMFVREWWVTRC